jgi:hypothetical protein
MEMNGPLFDGQAAIAASDLCEEIEREVGDEGVDMVRARLDQVLKAPTGHYRSQIRATPYRGDIKVTGEDVIYHWWLEGVGSRNFPVTRFKGYGTFKITAGALRARAASVAERVMRPFVNRMGA